MLIICAWKDVIPLLMLKSCGGTRRGFFSSSMTSSKMHEFGQFSLFSVIEAIYLFLYDKRVRQPEEACIWLFTTYALNLLMC
jgi:hypothetical protein